MSFESWRMSNDTDIIIAGQLGTDITNPPG